MLGGCVGAARVVSSAGLDADGAMLGVGCDVTVVTATDLRPGRLDFLVEMHASLHANRCSFMHVISVDGDGVVPAELLACDRVVVLSSDVRGAGAVRNEVLVRCASAWVTSVDDDDVLPAGSLDVRLAAASPEDQWAGGHLADLVDGDVAPRWEQPAGPGRYRRGDMLACWPDPESMFPYCGGALLMRTDVALAVGGWGTMRSDQDIFLHLTVTAATPGVVVGDVVLLYRKHGEGQRTQSADYLRRLRVRRAMLLRRARLFVDMFHAADV